MATTVLRRFQVAGHDAADWTASNPVLLDREWAVEQDTEKVKVGDGVTAWNALPYFGLTLTDVQVLIDATVAGLLDFKGGYACATNPSYPAAFKGDAYYVISAGKIGGASGKSVDIGDVVVASADNAGGTEAAVGVQWFVLEHNLSGALLAANNLSDVANPATALANLGAVASVSTPTAWVEPALTATWVAYTTSLQSAPKYRKNALGQIVLKGQATGGAINSTLFTLPAGFRPVERMSFVTNSAAGIGTLTIDAAGVVFIIAPADVAGTKYTSLDGIIFDTVA